MSTTINIICNWCNSPIYDAVIQIDGFNYHTSCFYQRDKDAENKRLRTKLDEVRKWADTRQADSVVKLREIINE